VKYSVCLASERINQNNEKRIVELVKKIDMI